MIKNIKKIEQDLKVKFKKPELLSNALTHKSADPKINPLASMATILSSPLDLYLFDNSWII